MKKLFFLFALVFLSFGLYAQNVGIGTNNPTKKFSVNGTIVVDHDARNTGTLDSASLQFGSNGSTGISSTKSPDTNQDGLDFWTGGNRRFSISETGNIGIGALPSVIHRVNVGGSLRTVSSLIAETNLQVNDYAGIGIAGNPTYKLLVGGNTRIQGDGTVTGNLNANGNLSVLGNTSVIGSLTGTGIRSTTTLKADERASVGGNIDDNFRLRVYDGASRFGGDVEATGSMTIGGSLDNTYRLRVIGGNSRFGGDAQVTGNLDAGTINTTSMVIDNTLTIAGKGSVRSNGPSALRIGFDSKSINHDFSPGEVLFLTANLSTPISGSNDDYRIFMSQYNNDPGGSDSMQFFGFTITNVDATANTCDIRLKNLSPFTITLKGTMYLTTIAKN